MYSIEFELKGSDTLGYIKTEYKLHASNDNILLVVLIYFETFLIQSPTYKYGVELCFSYFQTSTPPSFRFLTGIYSPNTENWFSLRDDLTFLNCICAAFNLSTVNLLGTNNYGRHIVNIVVYVHRAAI